MIPPLGELLPNTEIFRRLAARFGFEEPCFKASDEELMDDAVGGSLARGIEVRVWNDRGEVILPLEVTDKVPVGVVASEKGAWLSTSRTGQTISALVSADLRADLAEGACFNDTSVEVSRA